MIKKTLLGLAAVAVVVGGVAALSAYEAHVINVTATIENALSVTPEEMVFGTVFPNEILYQDLNIRLSGSFLEEDRVDDVRYDLKQKPKPRDPKDHEYCVQEKDELFDCILEQGGSWQEAILYCVEEEEVYDTGRCYPSLCSFLSKSPDEDPYPGNDGPSIGVPHAPGTETWGMLSKLAQDFSDTWTIDLEVPCFIGQCRQGEEGYLPPSWEHEQFGCDLWIEVTDISESEPE